MELTLTSILVRVSVMYIVALTLIRLSGKQSISELSTMDFIVTTILGDAFDTVIYGEVPILNGVVYFTTIASVHVLSSFLASRSELFFRLTNSPPTLVIHNGMVQGDGLQVERFRPETVASEMRLKGEDQLREVKEAWLEIDGRLSVVKNSSSKPVQKQDLKLLR